MLIVTQPTTGQSGVATVDISGGGAIAIAGADADASRIELSGIPASDVTVTFPATSGYRGRTYVVKNDARATTKVVQVSMSGADLWIPPGSSRVISITSGGGVVPADGAGDTWQYQTSISGPSGTGSFVTNLFVLPAGWAIEGILEYLQTPAGGGVTATSTVGLTVGPVNLLNNAAPVVKPSIRGYTSADWAASFTNGYYLSDTDKQIGQAFTVSAGSLVGAALVVTLRGRRVVT